MSPLLFSFQTLEVYTYPLFWGISWGLGYILSKIRIERNGLDTKGLGLFFLGSFISSWIGAKVFFLLAHAPNINWFTYWQFWLGGGFVFYGGLVFTLIYGLLYLYFNRAKFRGEHIGLILPIVPIAHGVGRLGCFLSGCCFGKETSLFESLGLDKHPVQLYESGSLFLLGAVLFWSQKKGVKNLGSSVALFIGPYSLMRFGLEFLRGDEFRGSFGFLSYSQGISLFLIILMIGFLQLRGGKQGVPT
jgi:phosphatidylglycerol:prolipoprotein diacylglycerol transferase